MTIIMRTIQSSVMCVLLVAAHPAFAHVQVQTSEELNGIVAIGGVIVEFELQYKTVHRPTLSFELGVPTASFECVAKSMRMQPTWLLSPCDGAKRLRLAPSATDPAIDPSILLVETHQWDQNLPQSSSGQLLIAFDAMTKHAPEVDGLELFGYLISIDPTVIGIAHRESVPANRDNSKEDLMFLSSLSAMVNSGVAVRCPTCLNIVTVSILDCPIDKVLRIDDAGVVEKFECITTIEKLLCHPLEELVTRKIVE